jgi:3-oxoacyl-[acyl-carrier protein] reductase
MSLADQVALVTGASRGIGQAIAVELGQRGAAVVGTATSEAGAQAIGEHFARLGIRGRGLRFNLTEADSVDAVLATVAEAFGAVTTLVNNAAVNRDNLLVRMKQAEWDAVLETNLTAVFRLSKACLRGMMKARRGRIINIASVVAATGNAGQANYAAAKAGLVGFSKSLAREVGSRGITVNVVAPGLIDTDMTRALPEAQRASLLAQIPLSRLGQPEDVAQAVAFLASPTAAYITGETLHVNGGMYMA